MRRWRMGTLTLGVMLIALGSCFILVKAGIIISAANILSWWPLAIISLGIEVLLGGFLFIDERCKLNFDNFSVFAILLTLFLCAGSFAVSSVPKNKFDTMFSNRNIFYNGNPTPQNSSVVNKN